MRLSPLPMLGPRQPPHKPSILTASTVIRLLTGLVTAARRGTTTSLRPTMLLALLLAATFKQRAAALR